MATPLALALALLLQGPPQDNSAGTRGALANAALFPKSTLALVTIRPRDRGFQSSGLYRFLAGVSWPETPRSHAEAVRNLLFRSTGLGLDQWLDATESVSVGWIGDDPRGAPLLLGVLEIDRGAGEAIAALQHLHDIATREGLRVQQELVGDTTVWTVRTTAGDGLALALRGNLLVVGPNSAAVEQAMQRGRNGGGFTELAPYARFVAEAGTAPAFLAALLPGREALSRGLGLCLGLTDKQSEALARSLDLERVEGISAVLRGRDGMVEGEYHVHHPAPRTGLLAALFGYGRNDKDKGETAPGEVAQRDRIPTALVQMVPPDAEGFALTHLAPATVWTEAISLLSSTLPQRSQAFLEAVKGVREKSGADIEHDLLQSLQGEVVHVRLRADTGLAGEAYVLPLTNTQRFQEALPKVLRELGCSVSEVTVGALRYSRVTGTLPGGAMQPCFQVASGYALLASSEATLGRMLRHLESNKQNPRAAELVQRRTPGTMRIEWRQLRDANGALSRALARLGMPQHLFPKGHPRLEGEGTAILESDEDGYRLRTRSPQGHLHAALHLAAQMVEGMPELARASYDATVAALLSPPQPKELDAFLAQVAEAQHAFRRARHEDRDQDGIGEYGTVAQLVARGLLPAEVLQPLPDAPEVYVRDGHRVRVALPTATDAREQHFVVLAWPDGQRTGRVFAATESRPALVNDLLAKLSGVKQADARDLYVEGRFGGALQSGWRDALPQSQAPAPRVAGGEPALPESRPAPAPLPEPRPSSPAGRNARELLAQLADPDTAVVARAAYELGQARYADAVPALSELVQKHGDAEVRRHAMAALLHMKDPRSRQASIAALESNDQTLRSLGAQNLGRLRGKDNVEPLVGMLATSGSRGGADRVQALLALGELQEPACLMQVAASVAHDDEVEGEALAWLFQTLSPRLPKAEEVTTLIAVLDHKALLLRRYAIQRLGELKDRNAVTALEARLAQEDERLQPLVQVALRNVQGDPDAGRGAQDFWNDTKAKAEHLAARLLATWEGLDPRTRTYALGGLGGLAILMLLIIAWRMRAARRAKTDELLGMVAPTPGLAPKRKSGSVPARRPETDVERAPAPMPGRSPARPDQDASRPPRATPGGAFRR
ncbi:MAG: HEAT repeat domain-containing protein [Planctomycetes bacterium]|nr:HEAT repeat domain-containing protein [Planctomycetota bacterium]